MRIVLILQYDGKNYNGWQVQPGLKTIQQTVEDALKSLTGEKCTVTGSGRTDSGVHALCQVAHFDTEFSSIPPEKYSFALNVILPPDIKVVKSFLAPEGFHARFSSKKKTYRYRFYVSDCILPLYDEHALQIYKTDEEKMKKAAAYLEGEHDFKCFLAANSLVKDTVRNIYSCKVERRGIFIDVTVTGNGFLYNMVRTIAGTLYFAGIGRIKPESVPDILKSGDRERAGKTLAAKGLTLLSVEYDTFKADYFSHL